LRWISRWFGYSYYILTLVNSGDPMKIITILLLLAVFPTAFAQLPADSQQFIRVEAPVVALTHVRIIDGTGAEPLEDQTIVIADGKIMDISPSSSLRDLDLGGLSGNAPGQARVEPTARILDLKGYTVLPGLVGMHNHMFFPMGGTPPTYSNMATSFSRLYLALGVTTIRTTGSVVPYEDLEIKKLIDSGRMIGPKMHITGPYLEGVRAVGEKAMHELTGPDDARRNGELLGGPGSDVVQSLYEHNSRRVARSGGRSTQARIESHWSPLFNRLSRSRGDRHR
jgi:hypothetical protein